VKMIRWLSMAMAMVVLAFSCLTEAVANTQVTTDSLRLTFDDAGQLQSAIACFPSCAGENPRVQQFGDSGVIGFQAARNGRWERSENRTETHYELLFKQANGASVAWRIPVRGYRLELEQKGISGVIVSSGESFRPRAAAGFGNWLEQSRYVVIHSGSAQQIGLDETDVPEQIADQWIGYRNRYWALMAGAPEEISASLATAEENQDARLELGERSSWSFYIGPVEPRVLAAADPALDKLLYAGLWFWLRWICFALFHLLAGIQAVIPSWGLAVMVMSLSVNILMTPLSRIAERFQQDVNETEARLAPELSRIKKNFKGEEQSAKILALYKTERVHPLYSMKSLMGVAVVIPVFIGAFDMLAENIHLLNAGFLWISDLSRPDDLFRLPFTLPFFGNELNLLPFLMTGLSVVASSLHNPLALNAELRKKQVRNMLLLAVAFFVLFYTFPAGMVLYWTTNNLISVIKSLWARR
jgi:YidC/Oxa1 family membrane protein insertase